MTDDWNMVRTKFAFEGRQYSLVGFKYRPVDGGEAASLRSCIIDEVAPRSGLEAAALAAFNQDRKILWFLATGRVKRDANS